MTLEEREQLQDNLIHQIMNDMDLKTLRRFAFDCLAQEYDDYSAEELKIAVKEYYPELLKDEQESERNRS